MGFTQELGRDRPRCASPHLLILTDFAAFALRRSGRSYNSKAPTLFIERHCQDVPIGFVMIFCWRPDLCICRCRWEGRRLFGRCPAAWRGRRRLACLANGQGSWPARRPEGPTPRGPAATEVAKESPPRHQTMSRVSARLRWRRGRWCARLHRALPGPAGNATRARKTARLAGICWAARYDAVAGGGWWRMCPRPAVGLGNYLRLTVVPEHWAYFE
jgi:hypothetical protein